MKFQYKILYSLMIIVLFAPIIIVSAADRYQPGLQFLYPYYDPDDPSSILSSTQTEFTTQHGIQLSPSLPATEQATQYFIDYAGINELGAIALSSSLYTLSNLEPTFREYDAATNSHHIYVFCARFIFEIMFISFQLNRHVYNKMRF